jgi:UDP-N-acetylglucosamine pyrophosphorylase
MHISTFKQESVCTVYKEVVSHKRCKYNNNNNNYYYYYNSSRLMSTSTGDADSCTECPILPITSLDQLPL